MRTRELHRIAFAFVCLTLFLAASPKDVPRSSDSPVADAAQLGDAARVRALLREGGDVNAAQGDGMTALHWAASDEDVELAEMLLYAGANVKAATRLGATTPLLLASKSGNAAMVERLLDAGGDANGASSLGITPLMLAAASGGADAVAVLVVHGADINAAEIGRRRTPLMFAAASNSYQVVDLLTAQGADLTASTKTYDIAKAEKKWRDAHANRRKLRIAAAEKKAAEEAKAKGEAPPPQETGSGKNIFAKAFGWLPGVGKREEPTPRRRRRRPYGELVGGYGGMTALHLAARHGNREAVDALLAAGADVNVTSGGDNTTPLLIATINGRFDLASTLVERGADPNLVSDAGATPLYGAINLQWAPKSLYPQPTSHQQQKLSYLELMEVLMKAGADPNARLNKKLWYSGYNFDLSGVDESGATAFWRAAYGTDVDAMNLLVAYGADPNLPSIVPVIEPAKGPDARKRPKSPKKDKPKKDKNDESGLPPVPEGGPAVSPLLAASGVGYGEGFAANSHRHHPGGQLVAVRYLLEELGADVNARDHNGYNALHHGGAWRHGNDPIPLRQRLQCHRGEPLRPHHRGHGERTGAAGSAVPGSGSVTRKPGLEKQPQVCVLLTTEWSWS